VPKCGFLHKRKSAILCAFFKSAKFIVVLEKRVAIDPTSINKGRLEHPEPNLIHFK